VGSPYDVAISAGSLTSSAGYGFSFSDGALTVNPAALTITASNQSKTYGATANLGTTAFTEAGLVNSDTITGVTLTSAGSAAAANVGVYTLTPSAALGTGLSNYTIAYRPAPVGLTVQPTAPGPTFPGPPYFPVPPFSEPILPIQGPDVLPALPNGPAPIANSNQGSPATSGEANSTNSATAEPVTSGSTTTKTSSPAEPAVAIPANTRSDMAGSNSSLVPSQSVPYESHPSSSLTVRPVRAGAVCGDGRISGNAVGAGAGQSGQGPDGPSGCGTGVVNAKPASWTLGARKIAPADLNRSIDDGLAKFREAAMPYGLTATLSVVGASIGLTVGIIGWLLRGGMLLSTFMSSIRTLHGFDPLVVVMRGRRRLAGGDSTVELLFEGTNSMSAIDRGLHP
jgi:hypothetical protein